MNPELKTKLLAKDPSRVIALDLNRSQLFCLELRIAAYKSFEHKELLELIGSRNSNGPNRSAVPGTQRT